MGKNDRLSRIAGLIIDTYAKTLGVDIKIMNNCHIKQNMKGYFLIKDDSDSKNDGSVIISAENMSSFVLKIFKKSKIKDISWEDIINCKEVTDMLDKKAKFIWHYVTDRNIEYVVLKQGDCWSGRKWELAQNVTDDEYLGYFRSSDCNQQSYYRLDKCIWDSLDKNSVDQNRWLIERTGELLYHEESFWDDTRIESHNEFYQEIFFYWEPAKEIEIPVDNNNKSALEENKSIFGKKDSENLKNVKEIKISDDFYLIYDNAFKNFDKLKKVSFSNKILALGDSVFEGCKSLESVSLNQEIKFIGDSAFKGCESLKEIILPKNLKKIGEGAFEGCVNLETIVIPKGVREIQEDTFKNCKNLKKIVIPASVKDIKKNAFCGCPSLTELLFEGNNKIFKSIGNQVIKKEEKGYSLYFVPKNIEGEYIVPDECTDVDEYAFEDCSKIERIVIRKVEFGIGNYTFRNCTNLKSLKLPAVRYISPLAFAGCRNLKDIKFESGDFVFKAKDDVIVENSVDYYSDELKSKLVFMIYSKGNKIKIPWYIKSVGEFAFAYRDEIEEVVFSDTLESIEESAFMNCTGLTEISVPSGVKVESHAFCGCTGLKKAEIYDTSGGSTFSGCENLTEAIIHEGPEGVGFDVFRDCVNLRKVSLPDSLRSLAEQTFCGCKILDNVKLPDNITKLQGTFAGCEKLKNVVLPKKLRVISYNAFDDCKSLERIVIPESVEEIKLSAFKGCSSLKEMIFEGNVKVIDKNAFEGCDNLPEEIKMMATDE